MKYNRCKLCDTTKKNRKWYSKTLCKSCYQKEYVKTNKLKRICRVCGSKNTYSSWYRGPKCGSCYHKDLSKNNPGRKFNAKYYCLLSGSKRKFSICNITKEQYKKIIENGCYYCSRDLTKLTGHSLDKIIPAKGYTLKNVLPCCGDCNTIRMNLLTVEETIKVISLIKKLRKTKNTPWIKR